MALAAALLAAALPLAGCRGASPRAAGGPIVLITLSALRDDVVGGLGGEPGLTPHLDALIRKADWAGRGVASSVWAPSSLASLLTGLPPWQHQVLQPGSPPPAADLLTLAEALRAVGYRTAAFPSGRWRGAPGYLQGFDEVSELGKGRRAADRLAHLDGGREFVWIHLPEPQAPYVRRDWLLDRVRGPHPPLPRRLLQRQVDALLAPGAEPRPAQRRMLWAMYRLNVAWADERLGRLLAALAASGQWDRTLLAVTADRGEDLAPGGAGGRRSRRRLEVPLVVKLPAGCARRLAVPPERRVATAGLWATLVEAAGGPVPPAVEPSLFRRGTRAVTGLRERDAILANRPARGLPGP